MQPAVYLPLAAALAAVAIAGVMLARDPGERANRLVALIMLCSTWWSLCEVVWGLSPDPETVRALVKASSIGWMWLGPLCLHMLIDVTGDGGRKLRRLLPVAYANAILGITLYTVTPWCVGLPVRVAWGWGLTFGPLFPVAFLPTFGLVLATLFLLPRFFPASVSRRERREARWLQAAIAIALALTTATDVVLPMLGIHVPRVGSASVLIVGAVIVRSVSRHGFYLLSPGAYTRPILEALEDGVALLRADGRIHACNGGLAQLCETSARRLEGVRMSDLLPELDATREGSRELSLTRPGGEPISVAVATTHLHDEVGGEIGQVVALRDLRDIEALRSRLVTAGRLAAVGELAAGIAHEINNPITYVAANLGVLRGHWETLAGAAAKAAPEVGLEATIREGEDLLEECLDGVGRVSAIVRNVGAFSHAGLADSEYADLCALLDNAVNVASLGHGAIIERYYEELPPVRCSVPQIKQVLLNLLLNALSAIDAEGHIRLTTARRGERVVVFIEDDGCGMAPETIERIFDPFFTTRPTEATGLGLAQCYRIVRNHGGEISVRSTLHVGSTFELSLPIEPDAGDADPDADEA